MEDKNKLSIPAAIVFAGLLIAFGIIISNKKVVAPTTNNEVKGININLKPVSAEDHILGKLDAPIIIVEYSDLECPFCKVFHRNMHEVMDKYGKDNKVAWIYRQFPIDSLHSKARKEAEATECANELGGNDGFWKFTDEVFETTNSNNSLDLTVLPTIAKNVGLDVAKFNSCLSNGKYASKVQMEIEDAERSGAQGTPYSIMVMKNVLKDDTVNSINNYVLTNNLFDRGGNPYIAVSNDKKMVMLNGAMPTQIVDAVIKMILK